MKFIPSYNITKFLLVLFFLSSTFALNLNRVSNKELPENFDATLTITNHSKNNKAETVEISLNRASLKNVSSGIQVTLRNVKGKIESPAFVPRCSGVYFIPFRSFVSSIDCTSSSWVYHKGKLNFYVSHNNDTISLSFAFPKKYLYLFGNTIDNKDVADLCLTISNNIMNYLNQSKEIKDTIRKNINDAISLENERTAHIKSKEDMDKYLKELEAKKKQLLAKRKKIEEEKAVIDAEIINIEASKTSKLKQIQNLENDMTGLDDNLLTIEKSVSEKSKATTFKEIAETDVNSLYEKVKGGINNLIGLHSEKDPAVEDLKTLAADVKANKDKILEKFKI